MDRLKGKVAIVTGSTSGIGIGIARLFAAEGAKVVICGRRQEKGQAVVDSIVKEGGEAYYHFMDITAVESIDALLKDTEEKYGKIDILVNNAGGGEAGPVNELDEGAWLRSLDLDLNGVFYCTKYFSQVMLEQGYGRIINVASILGKGGLPELPISPYCTAKGGVINFTKQVAAEFALKGVNCNAICPGFFASEANTPEAMDAMNGFITARTPMQRPGRPGELDSTVVFLAAHESSYVTGAIVSCDGGWTAV